MPDIDLDFIDRDQALSLFKHIRASRVDNGELVKHNTGVYLHEVPVNAETNLCAVPYNEADALGYFKIDFLNVGIYKGVQDEAHLIKLMNREPLWELLVDESFNSLIGKEWTTIMKEVWKKSNTEGEYFFKKSHSIAYAIAIVVQMNLICEQLNYETT